MKEKDLLHLFKAFSPSISFSKHVRISTSEYSEQSYIFGRKKGEICSFSLISGVFVRDGSPFPFHILMLRIGLNVHLLKTFQKNVKVEIDDLPTSFIDCAQNSKEK